jgi:hypothetical protein
MGHFTFVHMKTSWTKTYEYINIARVKDVHIHTYICKDVYGNVSSSSIVLSNCINYTLLAYVGRYNVTCEIIFRQEKQTRSNLCELYTRFSLLYDFKCYCFACVCVFFSLAWATRVYFMTCTRLHGEWLQCQKRQNIISFLIAVCRNVKLK